MIHSICSKRSDSNVLAKKQTAEITTTLPSPFPSPLGRGQGEGHVDFSNCVVKKPWGYEYLVFENEFVSIWMLQIIRKRKTSMHCHPHKKTALITLFGKATCSHLDGNIELNALDAVTIEKGAFHSTEATNPLPILPESENGIWVMEIESPPAKHDLVRMDDAYGRAGTSYEGKEQMVFDPKGCLKLEEPERGSVLTQKFLNCNFTVRKKNFRREDADFPSATALVSVIQKDGGATSHNPYLEVGGLVRFDEFYEHVKDENLENYTILTIENTPRLMKVSDYIISTIAKLGVQDVFLVSGGAAMHLLDSLMNHEFRYIANHHEQAAAMGAEGYARISGRPGFALLTAGPGGTNGMTGVAGAWIDSIPMIVVSGQVTSNTLSQGTKLRQFGIQEIDIAKLVAPITKYAVTVTNEKEVGYHLQKAIHLATSGRPGPVWLDIPLDIQGKMINVDELIPFKPEEEQEKERKTAVQQKLQSEVKQAIELLGHAKRPVLILGYGVRLACAEHEAIEFIECLGIPVITSWTASDMVPSDHSLYVGRAGIFGERAGNFAVQNADLILAVGTRLSIPQVGYNYRQFAREGKKIIVDIDPVELKKPSLQPDLAIAADAKNFLTEILRQLEGKPVLNVDPWRKQCTDWKQRYPVNLPEYKDTKDSVNSFYFVDYLSKKLGSDAIVVTDMGTSFTCTMQTFKTKKGQRLFTSSGLASMGFGLPGAIGACIGSGRRKTICIAGDGALQMNIQELQTLVHNKLPVILFVLNNNGYLTIRTTQQNHFGRFVGCEKSSGVSCPDMIKLANAYGIDSVRISNQDELHAKLDQVLAHPGPFICEIMMAENQQLIPRISSLKKPDGSIVSKPLEDLYPFLSREEFLKNMIIKPVEILQQ